MEMKAATQQQEPIPTGMMLGSVIEAIKVLNDEAGRNDIGSQTILTFLIIAQAGNSGLPQSQLLKLTGMTQAGVSRNLSRLGQGSPRDEGLRLVESHEDPMNRRHKVVSLTSEGRKVLEKIKAKAGRYYRRVSNA